MRIRLILSLLVLLAAPLRAQELGFRPTSEIVGSGDYKVVYGVEGCPDLVVAIAKYDDASSTFMKEKLARERSDLERLKAAGVPTATVVATGTVNGKAAIVTKRFLAATKSKEWDHAKWTTLDETSIRDLEAIRRALERSGLEIQDLQLGLEADGHVVVFDPEQVGEHVDHPSNVAAEIARHIAEAKEAIAWRRVEAQLRSMPEARDPVLRDFFTRRDLTGVDTKEVQAALLHYLETGETTDDARAVARALSAGRAKVAFERTWEGRGPNEAFVALRGTFAHVAAEVVEHVSGLVFKDTKGAERASKLLEVKKVPDAIDAARAAGSTLGPSTLRDRRGAPSGTIGVDGALGRLVDERDAADRDR